MINIIATRKRSNVMFAFMFGVIATLVVAVFFPATFNKMVMAIRSLWDKAKENEENAKSDF